MNNQDFWQAYVGDVPPGQFMYDYGAREPERCVARHLAKLPDVFGIVRQLTWSDAFAGAQHTREQVASALLAHLEDTREHWEQAVSQMPEQDFGAEAESDEIDAASSPDLEKEDHVHPQQIRVSHRPQHHGSAIMSRDHGGLPREHTAKESPFIVGGLPINTPLDQSASIEASLARSAPMFHAPEQQLPLGTAVDQDLPREKRPVQRFDEVQIADENAADETAPDSPAVDTLQEKVEAQFPAPEGDMNTDAKPEQDESATSDESHSDDEPPTEHQG